MLKRIGVPVFLATLCYQLLDTGAVLLLPHYDRAGYAAALLFWALPFSVAFALGYRRMRRDEVRMRQRDRWRLYAMSAFGAALGQLLGFVVVSPLSVVPDLTPIGMMIEALITSVFVLIGSFGGVVTAKSVVGDIVFTTRSAFVLGSIATVLGLATVYDPAGTPFSATFNFILGGWLIAIARFT